MLVMVDGAAARGQHFPLTVIIGGSESMRSSAAATRRTVMTAVDLQRRYSLSIVRVEAATRTTVITAVDLAVMSVILFLLVMLTARTRWLIEIESELRLSPRAARCWGRPTR